MFQAYFVVKVINGSIYGNLPRQRWAWTAMGLAPLPPPRQQPVQRARVFGRMGREIVVEVDPGAFRAAGLDAVGPGLQLCVGIVVPVPALWPVQADIDLIRRPDHLVRQPWSAARAEHDACVAEGAIDFFVPPALVPELHHVAAPGLELAH